MNKGWGALYLKAWDAYHEGKFAETIGHCSEALKECSWRESEAYVPYLIRALRGMAYRQINECGRSIMDLQDAIGFFQRPLSRWVAVVVPIQTREVSPACPDFVTLAKIFSELVKSCFAVPDTSPDLERAYRTLQTVFGDIEPMFRTYGLSLDASIRTNSGYCLSGCLYGYSMLLSEFEKFREKALWAYGQAWDAFKRETSEAAYREGRVMARSQTEFRIAVEMISSWLELLLEQEEDPQIRYVQLMADMCRRESSSLWAM